MKAKQSLVFCTQALLASTSGFAEAQTPPAEEGVEICGVVWATRNVDAPGTFTEKPTDPGLLYQWNRNEGWSLTDPAEASDGRKEWQVSTSREETADYGKVWLPAYDPCPTGWRVPTPTEVKNLLNAKKVDSEWVIETLTRAGRNFTDKTSGNTIFIPVTAARFRDGRLQFTVNSTDHGHGDYWSSAGEHDNINRGWVWWFDAREVHPMYEAFWNTARSVRCVKCDKIYDKERVRQAAEFAEKARLEAELAHQRAQPKAGEAGQRVELGGVVWAATNLEAPGIFATRSTDPGMFYQWDRKVGWSTTDPMTATDGRTEWDTTSPEKEKYYWSPENDPCPEGWRLPTIADIKALWNSEKVEKWMIFAPWGVNFVDRATGASMFLPIMGGRYFTTGKLQGVEDNSYYWTNAAKVDSYSGFCMGMSQGPTVISRNGGNPIRCVAE